jgi:hypothetical protein
MGQGLARSRECLRGQTRVVFLHWNLQRWTRLINLASPNWCEDEKRAEYIPRLIAAALLVVDLLFEVLTEKGNAGEMLAGKWTLSKFLDKYFARRLYAKNMNRQSLFGRSGLDGDF